MILIMLCFMETKLIGITGQSGVGKTTLLNLLGLLDLDFSGDYYIDEINISNLSKSQGRRNKN
ncbi:MAG: ATP-binding cassette domain-containing protein [Clostridium sp.]|nr:MAG: ATP-binding cassette domain-containing protein [Clostridium sp.]